MADINYRDLNNNTTTTDRTVANFGSMNEAYESLLAIVHELDQATDDLYNDVKKELGAGWAGEAKQFFEQKKAEWNAIEREMGLQLYKAAHGVKNAEENYRAAEQANIRIWSD